MAPPTETVSHSSSPADPVHSSIISFKSSTCFTHRWGAMLKKLIPGTPLVSQSTRPRKGVVNVDDAVVVKDDVSDTEALDEAVDDMLVVTVVTLQLRNVPDSAPVSAALI